jgi:hypothetical protein
MINVGRYIYNNYNSPQSQEFRRIFDENPDEAFKNMNDPSGRAVANVHDDAYIKV